MTNHRDLSFHDLSPIINSIHKDHKNKVLEVGCGHPDQSARRIFEEAGFKEYIGIDKTKYEGTLLMNSEKLEFPNNYFDVLLCCHSFEHFENPIGALKEFYRVLKKDGVIIIITPNPCEHQILDGDYDHIFVLTPMQMKKILRYTGFYHVTTYVQMLYQGKNILLEQDYNVISFGMKVKE